MYQDDISLLRCTRDFENYSWNFLRKDLMAGLSVALLSVPQAMACAMAAGLPLSCGLFSAIFSAILVALLGSSRHLIVGPSSAIAILIQAGMAQIFFTYYREASFEEKQALVIPILTQLALLVGIIQIGAAFFKFGRLTHFVSHSVIVAYICGVALAMITNQLFILFGMQMPMNVSSIYEKFSYFITHLASNSHWPTALIGLGCLGFLMLILKINSKWPAGAIMLVVMGLIAYFSRHIIGYLTLHEAGYLDWTALSTTLESIQIVGETNRDLMPKWTMPYFDPGIMNSLLPTAFAVALLSIMEATSSAKAIAANSGQRLSVNQEIFGLGWGNMLSSFIGAMPVSARTSLSFLNYEKGAQTRLSAISNALIVIAILFIFGFFLTTIPQAAFAALLILTSSYLIDLKQIFLCLKATRSDAFVLCLTIVSCLFFSLDIALYIGIAMSIALYLKKSAVPELVEFTVDDIGNLHRVDVNCHQPRKVRLIKVEGELFFGAAEIFQTTLKSIAEDDRTTKVIILQLKNTRDLDATACLALKHLYEHLKSSDRHLICCGITPQIWDVMSDSDLVQLIGKSNLFMFDERNHLVSVQKAFQRAKIITSQSTAEVTIGKQEPQADAPASVAGAESVTSSV